uniref:shadow of prion protein-like n=1 Tax=Panthera onca TaxID=9690 RepID=UPI0029549755|nr:shadow of prion protein-like [Panthera onca]
MAGGRAGAAGAARRGAARLGCGRRGRLRRSGHVCPRTAAAATRLSAPAALPGARASAQPRHVPAAAAAAAAAAAPAPRGSAGPRRLGGEPVGHTRDPPRSYCRGPRLNWGGSSARPGAPAAQMEPRGGSVGRAERDPRAAPPSV